MDEIAPYSISDDGSAIDSRAHAILMAGSQNMRAIKSIDGAFALLAEICSELGFDNVSVIDDVRDDRPFYDSRGRMFSKTVLGWPELMLNSWFEQRVWLHFPDAHYSLQEALPFASMTFNPARKIKEDRWIAHLHESTKGMKITNAVMVPVHGFGHASLMGWSCHDAILADAMLSQNWPSLMAFCYTFLDTVRRLDGRNHVLPDLTARQKDCLHWIAQGKTVIETAIILSLSPHTVEEHLRTAATRMGVRGRSQLIVKACQIGLV